MSGATSLAFRQQLLGNRFLGTAITWTAVGIALTRRVPTTNSSIDQLDEPVGLGYARVSIPIGASDWDQINDNEVANQNVVYFPTATGLWGAIHGWAAIGGASVIATGTLNDPLKVIAGIRPYLPAGAISFGLYD